MMRITRRWLRNVQSDNGFTIVEVLVAGVVLVVGLIFIAHFFTGAAMRVLASDTRSLMAQIATQEIETIRGLQYQDIGTQGGQPPGNLPTTNTTVVEGRTFQIVREVTYIEDSSYSGPYPANYRRVTVSVAQVDNSALAPIVMTTNIAGGAKGGTLDITVTDLSGAAIPGAHLTITDDVLVPHVLINASAIRTDDDGHLDVPGLTADPNGGYFVSASLSGYTSAALKNGVVVANGSPFTVVQLIMDRPATMNIHVTDQNGTPLSGVALTVTGFLSVSPWDFSQNVTTDANGDAVLTDIRYSTSLEPYFIQLVTPHDPPLALPSGVTAPSVDASFLPLDPGVIPVILDPGETQDVHLVISTGPVVSSLSPTSGSPSGGTSVVITGANLTGATTVAFGSANATSFTVNSATRITAVAPAGTGTVDVTVTTPQGTSATSNADHYTYQVAAPTVTSVSPTSGIRTGGTTVTIRGTNFSGATAVTFGGVNAASFVVNSTTQITAISPAAGTGTVDIRVTTPGGQSATSSSDRYTFTTHN